MNKPTGAIVGIGNKMRGDDGIGPELVRSLRSDLSNEDIDCIEHDGEVSSLIELLESYDAVLILDAIRSEETPGTFTLFDVYRDVLPAEHFSGSTHALGIEQAIELARNLGSLPKQCLIFGVHCGDFEYRDGLSSRLQEQLSHLTTEVLTIWNNMKGERHA